MSAQKKQLENGKSAQKMHRAKEEGHKIRHPKTATAHWESKVKKAGGSKMYGVQISYRGERHRFPLETANKEEGAEKARNIFLSLVAKGWEETLKKFNPEISQPEKSTLVSTVGELIQEVTRTVTFNPLTLSSYTRCLRRIVADIAEIGDQVEVDEDGNPKKDRRGRVKYLSRRHAKGNALWLAAVDAVSLSTLAPSAVQAWRVSLENAAKGSKLKEQRARVTTSSIIRNAKALFSDDNLEHARVNLVLPDPLPFSFKLNLTKPVSTFKAKLDLPLIVAAAQKELTGEPLKIFLLGLLSGLRKNEIDKLEWGAVNLKKRVISLEKTDLFEGKTEDAEAEVDLDPELVSLLANWRTESTGDFVIESKKEAKSHGASPSYRCEKHFKVLYAWLREQGVTAQKPLHELRKELGAHLASVLGIHAAQTVLRHAQISTTEAYYTDKKRKITGGLGTHLSPLPGNVVEVEFKAPPVAPKCEKEVAQ